MKFLKIYIFTVLIIFFRSISAYGEPSAKIAVVDVESILENSSAIGSIRKSINELTKTIEDEITEQEKEYKKRQQELLELHFGCHDDPAPLEARLAELKATPVAKPAIGS